MTVYDRSISRLAAKSDWVRTMKTTSAYDPVERRDEGNAA
jgi:hypothetical protein